MRMKFTKIPMGVLALGLALGLCGVTGNATVKSSAAEPIGVKISEENFPDEYIRMQVRAVDANNDDYLSNVEAKKITKIMFNVKANDYSKIFSYFPNLSEAWINTGAAKSVNIGSNSIKKLSINSETNSVVTMNNCKNLKTVDYYASKATGLDFKKASGYSNVTALGVYAYNLKSLTIPNESNITSVCVPYSKISKLNTEKCKKLKELIIYKSNISKLNLNKNKELTSVQCYESKLTSLSITSCSKLKDLGISDNKLKSLNVSKNKKLVNLVCGSNKLSKVNLAKNTKLTRVELNNNALKTINCTKNKKIKFLNCSNNKIKTFSGNKYIQNLYCSNNKLTSLPVNKLTNGLSTVN